MDQRSIEKHLRRWQRRAKPIADPARPETGPQRQTHSPTTKAGLSVADQLRKEWDPRQGGLPVFLPPAV
jgi:hypothetical protein